MTTDTQSGKALLAALVVLLILCLATIGGLAYLSRDRLSTFTQGKQETPIQQTTVSPTPPPISAPTIPTDAELLAATKPFVDQPQTESESVTPDVSTSDQTQKSLEVPEALRPGNPVVARVAGRNITRIEVLEFIQSLPDDVRKGRSAVEIFPDAVAEIVDTAVVEARVADSNMAQNPEVLKQLEQARKRIERVLYLKEQIKARMTENRLREAYDAYRVSAPGIEEIRARHILVSTQKEAQSLIKQLDSGHSFEALAIAHSLDPSAAQGGDIGYFTSQEVMPSFGKIAFALEIGAYTKEPVQTDLGWHVIKIEDKRPKATESFEALRPQLEKALQGQILDELLADWRAQADAQIYGINGPKEEISVQNDPASILQGLSDFEENGIAEQQQLSTTPTFGAPFIDSQAPPPLVQPE